MSAVETVDEFVGIPGDPEGYASSVAGLWDSGESQPGWCFVLEDGPTKLGRVGFRVAPTVSDPSRLGSLPSEELSVFGLHLPWEQDYLMAGRYLIGQAVTAICGALPELLEVRINSNFHSFAEARVQLMTALGMQLFQEKHGFFWSQDGELTAPGDRLEFRSHSTIGSAAYRAVMAPCGLDTLDRNDRYYWLGCGPDNWAEQMTEYLIDEDAHMWLIGYLDNDPVGYIAIASDEDWGATITHVGVEPQHRGNGYIHDLLAAGNAVVQQSGISSIFSDVDVLNGPMTEAMQRAGHVRDTERWHLSVFRTDTSGLTLH